MYNISKYKYSKNHLWVRLENTNNVSIGITNYIQEKFGDIVFVEMPTLSKQINVSDTLFVLESAKTTSIIESPVSGTIVEFNKALIDDPFILNDNPSKTWIVIMKLTNVSELKPLFDINKYQQFTQTCEIS